MKNNKVCHLTSVHPANDGRILRKECASLSEAGYEVTLIVAGAEEKVDFNVKILSVKKDKSRAIRMKFTTRRVLAKAIEVDADIYHFHDPELLPVGLKLKKLGKKVIYDAHEDVPRQILDKKWIPSLMRNIISKRFEKFENKIAAQLSGIITATPHIRNRFLKINKNTTDINNFPILSTQTDLPNWENRLNQMVYVGGITEVRGLTHLVEMAEKSEYPLILAGKFESKEYEDKLKSMPGWKNVIYKGFLSRMETDDLLQQSKIGIVTFYNTPAHFDSLPTKMFEYLLAGMPVILSDFPSWKEIVEKNDCGICVDPENANQILDAVNKLMKNAELAKSYGENGRKLVLNHYSWQQEKLKLIDFYAKL